MRLGQWLVTGKGIRPGVAYYSCEVERASKGDIYCGPEAKHFEAKEAGATEPIMEPEDKERQLLKRIEDQRRMIGVALFHLMHGDSQSARQCLQVALPDQKEDK